MNELHFLRPEWLWAFIPFLIIVIMLMYRRRNPSHWRSIIDPQLRPHVLIGKTIKARRLPLIAFILGGILTITALAGPAWKRLPTPVFRAQSALIIALDLSLSMDSSDLKPSRLIRARLKITDILKQRREGQTGLIVYAADTYTVTPLTQDTETISAQLSSLTTSIMPAQGSRPDTAIYKAVELFKQANTHNGTLLIITDGMDTSEIRKAIKTLTNTGHQLAILGMGTSDGAPIIKSNGGFLTDNNGTIIIPKLDAATLQNLALQAGGLYRTHSTNDSDINSLLPDQRQSIDKTIKTDISTDHWREEGPWLLLLLLPLATLTFRRGILCLPLLLLLPIPRPAHALDWDPLWLNADQRGQKAFQQKQHEQAAELFHDSDWKASAHYRAGQYEKALSALNDARTADQHYNKGNAQAQLGKIPDAIASYETALKLNPQHADASYNLDLLKKLQQQQNKDSNDKQNQSQNDPSKQNPEQNSGQNNPQQNPDSQQNQDPQQNPSNPQNKNSSASDTQQQQAEQNPATDKNTKQNPATPTANTPVQPLSETQQATEQWLRRIPDDPGGLLRRKFRYQYNQNKNQNQEQTQW